MSFIAKAPCGKLMLEAQLQSCLRKENCYSQPMFKSLMPKETCFFGFFEEHCRLTIEASRELVALAAPSADIAAHVSRIGELESKTDTITHDCIHALHETFITPFDRTQIHDLIVNLDDIIDSIDDVSSRIALFEIREVRAEFGAMANLVLKAALCIGDALLNLRNLHNDDKIKAMVLAVHQYENEADDILRSAVKDLLKHPEQLIELIKWKEILEHLEHTTDRCEDVADIIQGIIIEAS